MKYLYPQVDWDFIQVVGFDMDGTLYDESEFIQQVYRPISGYLALVCKSDAGAIYNKMLDRWTEKGSSYPYIFSEILEYYLIQDAYRHRIVAQCLTLFREFDPQLELSQEVAEIMQAFLAKYRLFLVTDGHEKLQTKKFLSLGLSSYFAPQDIGISGVYGKEYRKPSTKIVRNIQALDNVSSEHVVYFGDRQVDEEFAEGAGFHFIKVKCMRSEAEI